MGFLSFLIKPQFALHHHCTALLMYNEGPTIASLQLNAVPPEVTFDSGLQFGANVLQTPAPPGFIAESSYLKRPVGDTVLRRGQGMELCQLLEGTWPGVATENVPIVPLGLDTLRSAFTFRSEEPVELAKVSQSCCGSLAKGWSCILTCIERGTSCLQQTQSSRPL